MMTSERRLHIMLSWYVWRVEPLSGGYPHDRHPNAEVRLWWHQWLAGKYFLINYDDELRALRRSRLANGFV